MSAKWREHITGMQIIDTARWLVIHDDGMPYQITDSDGVTYELTAKVIPPEQVLGMPTPVIPEVKCTCPCIHCSNGAHHLCHGEGVEIDTVQDKPQGYDARHEENVWRAQHGLEQI
jgi:hypothetical protein